jgi:hypothetical protein
MDLNALTQYACVSRRTLGDWINDPVDPLPASRPDKKILVRRQAMDDYLERRRIKAGIVDEILKDLT